VPVFVDGGDAFGRHFVCRPGIFSPVAVGVFFAFESVDFHIMKASSTKPNIWCLNYRDKASLLKKLALADQQDVPPHKKIHPALKDIDISSARY